MEEYDTDRAQLIALIMCNYNGGGTKLSKKKFYQLAQTYSLKNGILAARLLPQLNEIK